VFIDQATIEVRGGRGGDGAATLRREKYVPRGGPDGGDGGRGGDVVAIADSHLRTLVDFTYRSHYRAGDGGNGGRGRRHGKSGEHVEIRLPAGTLVREAEGQHVLADLTRPGQRVLVARGGRGGRGNARFATPKRQTPRFAEKAEPGEARKLILELKLLADVGILGFPNAGKSSLIGRVSAAKPRIADYPFTTLVPNLGVVRIEEGVSFSMADMPGLIEGAHRGAGRGHDFLRHVERTRLLIHVLDVSVPDRDPRKDFAALNRELELYSADLGRRPQLVALNKIDLLPPAEKLDATEGFLRDRGCEVYRISAVTGEGTMALMGRTARLLDELASDELLSREEQAGEAELESPSVPRAPLRIAQLAEGSFEVSGEEVERAIVMTDLDNEEAVRHLHRRLQRMGVIRRLRRLGAKNGDQVRIGSVALDYVE
jgi:GTP-binding protein